MLIEAPILGGERPRSAPLVPLPVEPPPAMVGPNAVLQTVAAMRDHLSARACDAILANAQIDTLPSGEDMIPEIDALRLHRWLALHEPLGCLEVTQDAGRRTADYIIEHRIPRMVVMLLRVLPARLAAPLLMDAIARHAWTFIGAGRFEPDGAFAFAIDRRDANDPMLPPDTVFAWYAAVFTRLYQRLVVPRCRCTDLGDGTEGLLHHRYQISGNGAHSTR